MNERLQMFVRLGGLLLITVAIGLGMYFLFFRARPSVIPTVVTPPSAVGTNSLPTAGAGTPIVPGSGTTPGTGTGTLPISQVANGGKTSTFTLTTSAVRQPTVMANGSVAYYDPADGKFYSIDQNGTATALSQAKFPQASNVTFSGSGTEAAVEFPDGSNVVYNFEKSTQSTLPAHWEGFSFSQDGSQVAAKSVATDPSARALVISSADGSSATPIAALGANQDKVSVNWSPDGSIVGFSATGPGGSAFGQNEVYMIDKNGKDAGVLIVSGSSFTAKWTPDSSHLIYSVADDSQDYRATLWYADKDGDRKGSARREVPFQTLADKCTFSTSTVAYCAVPAVMPVGGGSAPDLITANDTLYKVDLNTMKTSLVAIPAVPTQMFNLSITPAGDALYYSDKSGRLNLLRLK